MCLALRVITTEKCLPSLLCICILGSSAPWWAPHGTSQQLVASSCQNSELAGCWRCFSQDLLCNMQGLQFETVNLGPPKPPCNEARLATLRALECTDCPSDPELGEWSLSNPLSLGFQPPHPLAHQHSYEQL